jgi:hypothetical protein
MHDVGGKNQWQFDEHTRTKYFSSMMLLNEKQYYATQSFKMQQRSVKLKIANWL